ncbi:Rrp15p-domain-containing protein [Phascolomyces articulosus]|uniref:Rrp15p-domain-containing protein n=1 Tax=Phascolomyces articulosus TaxID=60185 RepID=A0AAD5JYH1_9FUNG|nr:Rrp15p-domain-containing protein [Phascolomyces articulosus]
MNLILILKLTMNMILTVTMIQWVIMEKKPRKISFFYEINIILIKTNKIDQDNDDESKNTKKKNSSEAFSEAMTKILASSLTGSDRKQPIMARSKGTERKIEDEKLEYKARKLLTAEKKAQKERGRVIPDYTSFDYEKRLRKVATRGVVKLFNAIRTQQKATEVAVTKVSEKHKASAAIDKARNVSTMSKSNFLDLLKTGSS